MADILDELLDEQNYEKKLKYFKKYLIAVAILGIIGAIIIFFYNIRSNKIASLNIELTDTLVDAVNAKADNGNSNFDSLNSLVNQNKSRAGELAALEQVNIKIAANEIASAKRLLENIISNKNYSKLTANYAKIIWVNLSLDQENLSNQDKGLLDQYLSSFNNENEPLYGIGNLYKAFWEVKIGQKNLAIKTLNTIISSKAPAESTKEQAKALISNLSY